MRFAGGLRFPWSRSFRMAAGCVLLASTTLACFEQPIRERLLIRFRSDGSAQVLLTIRLAEADAFRSNPQARDRIESSRRSLLEGSDDWSRRFEPLAESDVETILWEKHEGVLVKVRRSVQVRKAEKIRELFRSSIVDASFRREERWHELTLVPGPGSRASFRQREEVNRHMELWVDHLAAYLTAWERLYTYLEERPDRARSCLGHLFEDLIRPEVAETLEEPSVGETALLESLEQAMEAALGLFAVPDNGAYSPEELSRLVYDPFPAPLAVVIPAAVLEREGFEAKGEGEFTIPGLSLWESFREASETWMAPNLLLVWHAHLGWGEEEDEEHLDLDAFVARPRRAVPAPPRREIRAALEAGLRPAPLYRLRWKAEPGETGAGPPPFP